MTVGSTFGSVRVAVIGVDGLTLLVAAAGLQAEMLETNSRTNIKKVERNFIFISSGLAPSGFLAQQSLVDQAGSVHFEMRWAAGGHIFGRGQPKPGHRATHQANR